MLLWLGPFRRISTSLLSSISKLGKKNKNYENSHNNRTLEKKLGYQGKKQKRSVECITLRKPMVPAKWLISDREGYNKSKFRVNFLVTNRFFLYLEKKKHVKLSGLERSRTRLNAKWKDTGWNWKQTTKKTETRSVYGNCHIMKEQKLHRSKPEIIFYGVNSLLPKIQFIKRE